MSKVAAAVATNLFEQAAAKAGTDTAPKAKGKQKHQIDIDGLREYAALKNAQKQIEAAIETLKEDVNGAALDYFLNSQRSDSINGIEGDTTASLQLRKRTTRSILSDQEALVLNELNIDIQQDADARFYINNDYSEDQELLGKVSKALDGIVPADFLKATAAKFVVGPKAVGQALDLEDEAQRATVVGMVTTQAARCKFGGSNEEALDILRDVLYPTVKGVK